MMDIIQLNEVESKILLIRDQKVILDSDVAELYGVETKQLNQAISRNLDKFPDGYLIQLTELEKKELVANCDRFNRLKHSTVKPHALTERGLYMLATILKSPKATQTTIAIIDTFAKVREVSKIINHMPAMKKETPEQQALLQRAGDIISDLVIPDNLVTDETEASVELNLAVVKFKYSLKRKAKS
ncbi:MAG: ORF6N domain-containing protein [Gammaproteobacteria bacterium]